MSIWLILMCVCACVAKAWRAYVLFRHADQTHRQRGIEETLQLCNQKPPTTDLDTLDILNQTLERIGGQDATMRDLWEKAAKAKSQDLEIQMRWFTYAFEADAWKSAQKVGLQECLSFLARGYVHCPFGR